MAKTRVNLYFDDDILKSIDKEAKVLGVSRTAAISMMVSQYIQQKKTLEVASGMLNYVKENKKEEQTNIYEILDTTTEQN